MHGLVRRIAWGLGTGRHVRRAAAAGDDLLVFAIDIAPRDAGVIDRIVASRPELVQARADGRLEVVVGTPDELARRFCALTVGGVAPEMLVSLAALDAAPEPARRLAKTIEKIHLEQRDAKRFGVTLRGNLRANADAIAGSPGLDELANACADHPAFVLAAGPSAANAVPWLADASRHGPIIAVDTALSLAARANVRVDVLTSVDPHAGSSAHVEAGRECVDVLAFQPFCAPSVVDAFERRVIALPQGDRLCDRLAALLHLPSLPPGGTVLLYAMQVAEILGCDPIVLVGADLAFVGGRSHADGTARADDMPAYLMAANSNGQEVATSFALERFRSEVESWIQSSSARYRFIDGGGAAISGARRISPAAIARIVARERDQPRRRFRFPVEPDHGPRRAALDTLLNEFDGAGPASVPPDPRRCVGF